MLNAVHERSGAPNAIALMKYLPWTILLLFKGR